ncbi:MAG: hypothetical protein GF320_11305 [Armatimonadia bacterium]|nr:hypothetical protein [Armatimonadia bacterium]
MSRHARSCVVCVPALWAFVVAAILAAAAVAQPVAQRQWTVQVLDENGNPVPGARAVSLPGMGPLHGAEELVTDADGILAAGPSSVGSAVLVAEGHALRGVFVGRPQAYTVTLPTAEPRTVFVRSPDGAPLEGVILTPRRLVPGAQVTVEAYRSVLREPFDMRAVATELEVSTDAEGVAVVPWAAPGDELVVGVSAGAFGRYEATITDGLELTLSETATLRLSAEGPDDLRLTGGTRFLLSGIVGDSPLRPVAEVDLAPDGTASVVLAEGRYAVSPGANTLGMRWLPPRRLTIDLRGGEVVELALPFTRSAVLSGHLVNAETGIGVQGRVSLSSTEPADLGRSMVPTDPIGGFWVRLRPGEYIVHGIPNPSQGVQMFVIEAHEPGVTVSVPAEGIQDLRVAVDVPPVQPGPNPLEVVVHDEGGQPVQHAAVHMQVAREAAADGRGSDGSVLRPRARGTGPDGVAVVPIEEPCEVWVYAEAAERATLSPLKVTVPAGGARVELTIEDDVLASATVRVVDSAGMPIINAQIGVGARSNVQEVPPTLGAHRFEPLEIPGGFRVNGLRPGSAYWLYVMAEGYVHGSTDWWTAQPGEAHDFGEVVLEPLDAG